MFLNGMISNAQNGSVSPPPAMPAKLTVNGMATFGANGAIAFRGVGAIMMVSAVAVEARPLFAPRIGNSNLECAAAPRGGLARASSRMARAWRALIAVWRAPLEIALFRIIYSSTPLVGRAGGAIKSAAATAIVAANRLWQIIVIRELLASKL